MPITTMRRTLGAIAAALCGLSTIAGGQAPRDPQFQFGSTARTRLDSLASAAERRADDASLSANDRKQSLATADDLHRRLRQGDFRPGDRIVVAVRGEPAMTDTVTLGDSLMLRLAGMTGVPLAGALRAEAQDRIANAIAMYVRAPEVRVVTLVRVGLLGQVARPGYYQLSADVPMSDALMAAGGPTAAASPDRTIVRRNARVTLDAQAARSALVSGATLAQLDIRSGDEIVVAEKSQRSWGTAAQVLAAVSGIVVSVVYVVRR